MFQKLVYKDGLEEVDAIEQVYNTHFKKVAHLIPEQEAKRLSPDERKMILLQKEVRAKENESILSFENEDASKT